MLDARPQVLIISRDGRRESSRSSNSPSLKSYAYPVPSAPLYISRSSRRVVPGECCGVFVYPPANPTPPNRSPPPIYPALPIGYMPIDAGPARVDIGNSG